MRRTCECLVESGEESKDSKSGIARQTRRGGEREIRERRNNRNSKGRGEGNRERSTDELEGPA